MTTGELESARTKTEDAGKVTAGPRANDIATGAIMSHQEDHKNGTDISP